MLGIVNNDGKPVAEQLIFGLMALQHRGQEAAGIAVVKKEGKIVIKKTAGLAGEGFQKHELIGLEGQLGLGHVRYSTVGDSSLEDAQPLYVEAPMGGIALAHNGNIVNYNELRDFLEKREIVLKTRNDGEILLRILSEEIKKNGGDFFKALKRLAKLVEGAYSAVCVTGQGDLLVFRDPLGFRPLCYGFRESSFICASESVAIDMCEGEFKGDVSPGEALLISGLTVERKQFAQPTRRAHCMFEYVYFSRPDSVIEGRSVYDVRLKLGEKLANTLDCQADVIVPVPDTSRPAAEGASRVTGINVAEGLIKNRYVHRTFIMPDQRSRENAVKAKLNPLKSVIKGKRVLLIDDSIVRGTTLKGIVNMVRKAGAREVHIRITCPPIVSPCFYGIDIATHRELIAAKRSVEEIREAVGADSLAYQTIESLVEAIGLKREELCTACLTGVYVTRKAQSLSDTLKNKSLPVARGRTRYIELKSTRAKSAAAG